MQIKLSNELTEILQLIAAGKTNKEISVALNYSLRSVERRIKILKNLYKVQNRMLLAQEFLTQKFENI